MILVTIVVITVPVLLSVAFFTLAERHIMASMQRRLGPHTSGLGGILQPFWDYISVILLLFISYLTSNYQRRHDATMYLMFHSPISEYHNMRKIAPFSSLLCSQVGPNINEIANTTSNLLFIRYINAPAPIRNPIEGRIYNDEELKDNILKMLPFPFVCIIIGLMLGDGYMDTYKKGEKNSRLKVNLAAGDKGDHLIMHLVAIFDKYGALPKTKRIGTDLLPPLYSKFDKRTGNTYYSRYVYTRGSPVYNYFRDWWYPEGPKVVPKNIGEFLTPEAIAIWYMCDGYLVNGVQARFCTDGFTRNDAAWLGLQLNQRYGWQYRIVENKEKDKIYYRLLLEKASMPSFVSIVKPHCLPGSFYKFPAHLK